MTISSEEQGQIEWERRKEHMRIVLIGVAQRGQTISYGELAGEVGYHHRNPNFMKMLLQICKEELDLKRGRICALVVKKSSGIPGSGYFGFSEAYDGTVADAEEMWRIDRDWVHDYWEGRSYSAD